MSNSLKLPSIDYKEFKILTLCKNKEFANINYMAEELKVTTRSVRTYIKQLNDNLGEDIAQIIYVKGHGYKLEIRDNEIFDLLFEENRKIPFDFNVKDERILYLLDFFTEFDEVITIDQLADKISVGRTTIVNDIKSVREILNEYNLDLIKKQNFGMWLKGNEFDKRLLLLNYIYKDSKNDLTNSKYVTDVEQDSLKKLKNSILKLFKEDSFYATDQIFEETIKYILVQVGRIKNGNEIFEYDKRFDLLGSYDEYNISKEIKIIVEDIFDITLNEYETLYLTLPLVSGNAAPISKFVSNKPKLRNNIEDLMELIFKEIYVRMGIIIEDQSLKDSLGYHLEFTLNRLLFKIKLKNLLLDEMKENYVLPYNLARITADVIEDVYNLTVPEDEIGYIAIHFGSYLEKNMISNTLRNVAIVCSTGLGATNLITIRIRKIIGQHVKIDTFSMFEIDEVDFSKYDLVFTTNDVDINSNAVLKIDAILDENKLRNKIEKIIYLNNSKLSKNLKNIKLSDNLLIGAFLQEKYFYVLNKKTISAALKTMIDSMIEDGIVGEKFKKDILEREKTHPTIFNSGLLLPHSVNDKSDEMYVSIGVLNKPIEYLGVQIKVIMLIAFSTDDTNTDLLVKIYEEALSLGQNDKYINQLAKCRTFSDLTSTLLKISIK
ncbi:BglG family transcription antiterminator [Intestinibacter sp.]|uniref:BglG family transcription antiterminator n=1 Tax=Intestinibacter sp. TaxID=1965304 RepID=UPI003F14147E